jgi:hypothetical protein
LSSRTAQHQQFVPLTVRGDSETTNRKHTLS